MAYMTQEKKKELSQGVKNMLDTRYPDIKIKASYSVVHDSTICMTIQACSLDLLAGRPDRDRWDVNIYAIDRAFAGQARDLMQACVDCLNKGNWDDSDAYRDYCDVGWYVDIRIGTWDKPFKVL